MEPVITPGSDEPQPADSAVSNKISNISLPHRPKPEQKDDPQDTAGVGEDAPKPSEDLTLASHATEGQPAKKKKPKKKSRGGKGKVSAEALDLR